MSLVAFPYKVYKGTPCPIVPVEISGPTHWIRTEAYVDSGAFYSIFSHHEANAMGINLVKGKQIFATVGDGGAIPVFLHKLKIRFGKLEFPALVGFSPRLGVGFNLLGRYDFFSRFDVTFSDCTRFVFFSARSNR